MKAPVTALQVMSHSTVVATINCLSEMAQRLQDENDELKAALAQPDAFEQGRQEGMKQERALRTLSRLGQEIEAQPAQEPFGYFKAEPFGWVDCAETDDGAKALYEAPPQRPWVSLTEVDILAASRHWRHAEDFMAGVYWAAGTLKEKNT